MPKVAPRLPALNLPNAHKAAASSAEVPEPEQMSDISTDSSLVSEQKMELKPLPPSFVRPSHAVQERIKQEEARRHKI
jgi:hypothetical protein